jgi:hypothetical protein
MSNDTSFLNLVPPRIADREVEAPANGLFLLTRVRPIPVWCDN